MIRFENLTLGYDRHPAVHHLSLEIPARALVAVVGPNGAGKSTLLKGLAGELRPIEGRIVLDGLSRRQVAYMPQRGELDESFPATVFDLVAMGLWREMGPFGRIDAARRARVEAALAGVGLSGFESRAIGSLSGGQLQRARFARLSLQDSPLLLLDEPFAAIDSRTVEDLMQRIRRWQVEGRTVLVVAHDLEQVRRHFPICLLMAREPVAFGPTAQVLTDAYLARARRLSEAFDEQAPECHVGADASLPQVHAPAEGAQGAGGHQHGHQHHGHAHSHVHSHDHADHPHA